MPEQTTLDIIARAAVDSTAGSVCPAEVVFAQCALESGWLKHAPGNNCFGIKARAGDGTRTLLHTVEWFTDAQRDYFLSDVSATGRIAELVTPIQTDAKGRHKYACLDWFATFPTLAACMAKRVALFGAGPYRAVAQRYRENNDFEAMVRGMAKIYATDPKYADNVLAIVRQPNVQAALRAAREGKAA